MEYFSTPFDVSLLKNHIMKDPILDWFNIQERLNKGLYERDITSSYKEFILNEWKHFKNNFFDELIKKSGQNVPKESSIEMTKEMIKDKKPLILGAKLPYTNMIVKTDILINVDLFISIFPKIKNYPLHSIKKQYIMINLSYSNIHFKNDIRDCLNEGMILYKKCKSFVFSICFEKNFGYKPKEFLIGKEYYYKKNKLENDEYICNILYDDNVIRKYISAYHWIITIRTDFNNLKIDDKPSHKELYPNMNNTDSDWESEKKKIAGKIKEITLLWNISYEDRCNLHGKNIFSWDDPKLISELKESKKKKIQEQMIHMNKSDEILIYPRKNISNALREILQESDDNNIFFDVESFLSIDEKVDFFNKKEEFNKPIIAIIGFFYKEKFIDFTIQSYQYTDEKIIIKKFSEYLWNIYNNYGRVNIFHWGHAECKYMEYIHSKHGDIDFPEYILIDLLDHFRLEPIIIHGVFKFGLKSIGKALYNKGLINTTWKENDNGLDAMIKFKEICKKNKKIPLKRYLIIKQIIEYNEIDCKVLKEIYFLLKNNYSP